MRLQNLELPENLYWSNEFKFKGIAQSVERTVAGALIIESAPLVYGQKITLMGAWSKRELVIGLKALESSGGVVEFVDNAEQVRSVVFDIEADGLQAELLSPEVAPDSETLYELTINLLTVEPVL